MLTISSRQFRDNQKSYLDKVAQGVEILITRRNEAFKLIPVSDDTLMTKQEFFAQIERAMDDVKHGRTHTKRPDESVAEFLERIEQEENV